LIADDAVNIDEDSATTDQYISGTVAADESTGERFLEPKCQATAVGPPITVICTYTMENAWSVALGVGPFTGSNFRLVIDDGQIQRVDQDVDVSQFDPQVFAVWWEWLDDNHPGAVEEIYGENWEDVQQTPEHLASSSSTRTSSSNHTVTLQPAEIRSQQSMPPAHPEHGRRRLSASADSTPNCPERHLRTRTGLSPSLPARRRKHAECLVRNLGADAPDLPVQHLIESSLCQGAVVVGVRDASGHSLVVEG
jgi:hypothetical protein